MIELHGYGDLILQGTIVTIKLSIASLFFGLIFGLLGATAKLSRFRLLKAVATFYTTVVRGLPELLVVMMIFFGAGVFIDMMAKNLGYHGRVDIGSFWPGVVALSLMFGAYATEVFRMAIQEIPKGQWESAQSLGMRPVQTFFRIILPQVWLITLPGLGNLALVTLKDTALISLIGLKDIAYVTSRAGQTTQEPFTFAMVACALYLCLTAVIVGFIAFGEWRANPSARYAKKLLKNRTESKA